LTIGVEYWLRAVPKWGELAMPYYWHLGLATVLCAAGLFDPLRRPAFFALAVSHAVLVWREFPSTGNHAYLEVAFCLLAAALRLDDAEDRRLYLRSVRWVVVIVLFYSGLQKLVHGYWSEGQYLAFSLGSVTYRSVLGLLLPADELARLSALRGEVGDGPYVVSSWPLLVLSNGTWLLEMALAPLLVWPRTRHLSVWLALGFLLAIQVAAREVFFGLIFANALVLFLPGDKNRLLVIPVAMLLLTLALSRIGILPELTFY
jgi:hypothetical protein